LAGYQAFWAARADLLARVGRHEEAHHAYDLAIGLERDPSVRMFLQQRQRLLIREKILGTGSRS
jgi:RNA polymerase sigma-70 factor (ECF subfamily)